MLKTISSNTPAFKYLNMSREHRKDILVSTAILTVSTTRTEKTDLSGAIIRDAFTNAGMQIAVQEIVTDDVTAIKKALNHALETANCIIFCGGTGLTSDDCTIEAVTPFFEKTMDGFGELFRRLSYDEVQNSVILTRATAGIINGKVIFCIPGSPNAAKLAAEKIIVPEIRHTLTHAGQ